MVMRIPWNKPFLHKKAGDIYRELHSHGQHSLSFLDKRLHTVTHQWRRSRWDNGYQRSLSS